MFISPSEESKPKLKLDKKFQPCPVEGGEEVYRNGIFHFNITRLLAFLDAHPARFPIEFIALSEIPNYGDSNLDVDTVRSADLSRPILLAEISPGRFNVIDGNHRVAKARHGAPTVPARRIHCSDHLQFLTSFTAYEKYVEYWNGKVREMRAGFGNSDTGISGFRARHLRDRRSEIHEEAKT